LEHIEHNISLLQEKLSENIQNFYKFSNEITHLVDTMKNELDNKYSKLDLEIQKQLSTLSSELSLATGECDKNIIKVHSALREIREHLKDIESVHHDLKESMKEQQKKISELNNEINTAKIQLSTVAKFSNLLISMPAKIAAFGGAVGTIAWFIAKYFM